jgi:hypothetical protein
MAYRTDVLLEYLAGDIGTVLINGPYWLDQQIENRTMLLRRSKSKLAPHAGKVPR